MGRRKFRYVGADLSRFETLRECVAVLDDLDPQSVVGGGTRRSVVGWGPKRRLLLYTQAHATMPGANGTNQWYRYIAWFREFAVNGGQEYAPGEPAKRVVTAVVRAVKNFEAGVLADDFLIGEALDPTTERAIQMLRYVPGWKKISE